MPASLAVMYESLRAEVMAGHARPEGLAAVVYHGFVHGLTLLVGSMHTGTSITAQSSSPIAVTRNRELLHLLANMVLQTQSEVMHVY